MSKIWCVYKHTTPNNKVYVGITSKNPIKRWRNGKGYPYNKYFTSAIQKYGWNNIKHEILYTDLSKKDACIKEIELISKYKSNQRQYGYNQSIGGESGNAGVHHKMNEETKLKLRQRMIGNKIMVGRHISDITKNKISLKNGKRVNQYDKNMNFINHYTSANKAKIITSINHIDDCCRGTRKTAGGYIWKYSEEEI